MQFKSLIFILMSGLLLASCSYNVKVNSVKNVSEFTGKSVAVFDVRPRKFPRDSFNQITVLRYETELDGFASIERLLKNEQVKSKLINQPQLNQEFYLYVDTFGVTAISDKDIAFRLAKYLDVEQFLFIQLDQYACIEKCDSGKQMTLWVTLLDVPTYQVVWRGRVNEHVKQDETEEEQVVETAKQWSDSMLEEFMADFIVPWHLKRFRNLEALAQAKPATDNDN